MQAYMDDPFSIYVNGTNQSPLFLVGDALDVLRDFPDQSIDCCITSPPYWGVRQYANGGIGQEPDFDGYIHSLLAVFAEVRRVLKDTGSLWLNIGDRYVNKGLMSIPWRIAIRMTDEQGWVLRNTVIWNKVKGAPDNAGDKLRCVYEPLFHFVKKKCGYYYDIDSIRHAPCKGRVVNGTVISATGVSGIRYRRKIELSTALTDEQKREATEELGRVLSDIEAGRLSDFRMIIRGEQRATHSDSEALSGRAKELREKGFYFLKYNPKGSKPGDVWDILPEDTQGREGHFAAFPEDLCKDPIVLTCPADGVVLDPFVGTGTTTLVAEAFGRKSVGIDIAPEYIAIAKRRCMG